MRTSPKRPPWGVRAIDLALLVGLAAAALVLVILYVGQERAYYWSDYSNYQELTQAKIEEFGASPLRAVYTIWRTTGDDYGQLPVLPLIPPTLMLGDSRAVFVVSLALLYLVPLGLVYGALAASVVRRYQRTAFWLAAFLTVATPAVVVSILRGYPDAGGAALAGLAVLLFVRDTGAGRPWSAGAAGALLAAAILFRRPFAIDAVAFGIVALLVLVGSAAAGVGTARAAGAGSFRAALARTARARLGRLAALGVGGSLTLLVAGTPFVARLLTANFGELYASYKVPPLEGLAYYGAAFGAVAWLAAALGFVLAVKVSPAAMRPTAIIAGLSLLTLAIWVTVPGQLGEHYPLHFAAFVVVGVAILGVALIDRLRGVARSLALVLGGIALGVNLVVGLVPVGPSVGRAFFAALSPPLRHPDYHGIARLVQELRSLAGTDRRIYVAASSDVIGCSLLASADRVVPGPQGRLQFLPCIHIDSRDEYPVEKLLWADVVVVARPVQYHLAPEQQTLVRSVVDAFTEGWPIARDFGPHPISVPLLDGQILVDVYQRVRPASLETAIDALHRFIGAVSVRPGGQKPWIGLSDDPARALTSDAAAGRTDIELRLPDASSASREAFLSVDALAGRKAVEGTLSVDCATVEVEARFFDQAATELGTAPVEATGPNGSFDISLPDGTRNVALVVTDTDTSSAGCDVKLDRLTFS